MRTCIVCRTAAPRGAFVRVVCDPEGRLFVDRLLKAPGRGAHVCYDRTCLEQSLRRKAYNRAFEGPVAPMEVDALVAAVVAALDARIQDRLALARRAGQVRSGGQALSSLEGVALLLLADDAADDSAERLIGRAKSAGIPWIRHGTAARLGEVLGKGRRIAVGLTDAAVAAALDLDFERRNRVLVAASTGSR
ncbi:MAG: YlxR family protein [bacterium]